MGIAPEAKSGAERHCFGHPHGIRTIAVSSDRPSLGFNWVRLHFIGNATITKLHRSGLRFNS